MFDDVMKAIESRAKRFGPMRDANAYATIQGECNDTAEIWLRIDGGKIRKGSFMTDGCGWSKHCCDTAVQLAEGMTPAEVAEMAPTQVLEAAGEVPEDHQHCALLAADTIKLAIEHYRTKPAKIPLRRRMERFFNKERNHA